MTVQILAEFGRIGLFQFCCTAHKIMARIIIELPEQFQFSTTLTVYQSHINHAGHVDNALLLTLVSEARARFFKSLDVPEVDRNGLGIVVADTAIQYLSEAFHGEELTIDVAADDFNKYGCDLVYRIRDAASGRDVARAKTGIVFFDYSARRIHAVPEVFRERAGGAEAERSAA